MTKKIGTILPWVMPLTVLAVGGLMYASEKNIGNSLGAVLIVLGVVYYFLYAGLSRCLIDLRGLLSLSWLTGVGLASFRRSHMHTPWSTRTWICFFGFYVVTILSYELWERFLWNKKAIRSGMTLQDLQTEYPKKIGHRLYRLIFITAAVSFGCFALEVLKLRYIPLFAKFTHAYNYFHVTGLHYFTFSSMMVHAVTALYIGCRGIRNISKSEWKKMLVANLFALSIPILCISKLQFLLIFFLPLMIVLKLLRFERLSELPWKRICPTAVLVLGIGMAAGVLFTARRNYEPGYLNQIFDMRDENTPMISQYLYMYTAHNFANFNYLTENITKYSGGLRQAFPFFALTGLKFFFPDVTKYTSYLIKPELSTLTIIYDAYYDFGVIGVMGFAVILGSLLALVTHLCLTKQNNNPMIYLFYGQFAVYMLLSFFDTWFSNPTTWFWFFVTFAMYWYVGRREKGIERG